MAADHRRRSCTASLIHIGFNMLALWWIGAPVEQYLGRARFIGALPRLGPRGLGGRARAGAARRRSVGASGAIFGILGAMLILEWQATGHGSAATR